MISHIPPELYLAGDSFCCEIYKNEIIKQFGPCELLLSHHIGLYVRLLSITSSIHVRVDYLVHILYLNSQYSFIHSQKQPLFALHKPRYARKV